MTTRLRLNARLKARLDGRRVCRILTTAVVAFAVVQIVAGFVLDWGHPEIRFPDLYDRIAKLRHEPRPPDVVLLGSSRFASASSSSELTQNCVDDGPGRLSSIQRRGRGRLIVMGVLREMKASGISPRTS